MTTVVITGPVFTHDDFEEAEELIYFGLDKTTLLTTGNHISCYVVSVPHFMGVLFSFIKLLQSLS